METANIEKCHGNPPKQIQEITDSFANLAFSDKDPETMLVEEDPGTTPVEQKVSSDPLMDFLENIEDRSLEEIVKFLENDETSEVSQVTLDRLTEILEEEGILDE